MPDTVTEIQTGLTLRQRLDSIAGRFENRERLVDRAHALRWLRFDLDRLWSEAQAEEFKFERYSDIGD